MWSKKITLEPIMNIQCKFCGYVGLNSEFGEHNLCPNCGNETKADKYLKSIAESLHIIADWCNENWYIT